MDNQNKDGGNGSNGTGTGAERSHEDRRPAQFLRIDKSKDRKWIFVDYVTRYILPFKYLDTIVESCRPVVQADGPAPAVAVEQPAAQAAPGKSKRARKENDRTT